MNFLFLLWSTDGNKVEPYFTSANESIANIFSTEDSMSSRVM